MTAPVRIGARDRFEFAVLDHLERIETQVAALKADRNVTPMWLSKKQLAAELGVSVRWVEGQMAEGLPRREIAGKVLFNLPTVEGWLEQRGKLRRVG